MASPFDVLIVGGGPAGATCAAFCAQNGLRTLVIERAIFPREKVCGDCLNPNCRPIFERLGVANRVAALPHARLAEVEFIGLRGQSIKFSLGENGRGEIAVKRSALDALLLQRARELGVDARENLAFKNSRRAGENWVVRAGDEEFSARLLIGADGRNSSVAHALGLLPRVSRDRIALQTHFPLPEKYSSCVALRLLPHGYCGLADVGGGEANICLVAQPGKIDALKLWARENFSLPRAPQWRTITPLSRAAVSPAAGNLFLVGDAARVVEPFTGEGIFYALASGELAAKHIVKNIREKKGDPRAYVREHAELYRGRRWINAFAKLAVLHPRFGDCVLEVSRRSPRFLRFLTDKIVTLNSSVSIRTAWKLPGASR